MMLGSLVGHMVLAVGNMKPAQMMTWMVSFPWMLLLFFLFGFVCQFMLWSVVSFLTDAECADQNQVTDWTDPETSEITDSILGEYIFPYKCLSKELPFITPASFLISFCTSFGFFSDASAQEDHVVNDIGESTFEETSNTWLDSNRDKSAVCPTYEVVEAGSKRSGRRLIDNQPRFCMQRAI